MEKEISELKELDENEIAQLIYDRIDAYWDKFPNIWKYVTKDDMATQTAMDLYRPRKADGVPHIIHYYNTRGERSLKPLIGMIAWNVLVAEARDIHSTGVFNKDERRNVYKALSMESPFGDMDGDSITLGDTISDNSVNVDEDVTYTMVFENMPNKVIENLYYMNDNGVYEEVTYKSIMQSILDGYNLTQLGEKLYKKSKQGKMVTFRETSTLVREVKEIMKQYLAKEYNYTEEKYRMGWSL